MDGFAALTENTVPGHLYGLWALKLDHGFPQTLADGRKEIAPNADSRHYDGLLLLGRIHHEVEKTVFTNFFDNAEGVGELSEFDLGFNLDLCTALRFRHRLQVPNTLPVLCKTKLAFLPISGTYRHFTD